MRRSIVGGTVALAIAVACAGQVAKTRAYHVTAYLQNAGVADPVILGSAKVRTGGMFAGIGVGLKFDSGRPRESGCPARPDAEVIIRLAIDTPASIHPGAPAFSLPYEQSGERVTVFYDRAVHPLRADPTLAALFLSHVLAHEIVHAIEGVAWHSEEGLMKAQWSAADMRRMKLGPLPLGPRDVQLIRQALERGGCPNGR